MSEDPPTEAEVAEVVARARAEHPDLEIPDGFEEHLRSTLHRDPRLHELAAGDLLVVFASCRGDSRAQARFENSCIQPIGGIVAHMQLSPEMLDEVKQRVRTKLLVAEGGQPPKLLDYVGRARLRNWVGVVATREALGFLRRQPQRSEGGELLEEIASPAAGPELNYLKEHYRDAFAEAFAVAVSALSARARNALRHHYVHGLSIDEIGAIYGIHRSNAARRIAKARDDLLAGTRRELVLKLNVGRPEVDSIMRLIQSRIDVSLRGALDHGKHAEPDEG